MEHLEEVDRELPVVGNQRLPLSGIMVRAPQLTENSSSSYPKHHYQDVANDPVVEHRYKDSFAG